MVFRRTISILAALALSVGVLAQFAQTTDPTFPLLYFTIDTALLAIAVSVMTIWKPTSSKLAFWRGSLTVSVVLAALVYTTVIAPASHTGTWYQPWDDLWVRVATSLLHGVGPLLVVLQFFAYHIPSHRSGLAVGWCSWPLVYLLAMLGLQAGGIAEIPYSFLHVEALGGAFQVVLASLAVALMHALLGCVFLALHSRFGSPSARGPHIPEGH